MSLSLTAACANHVAEPRPIEEPRTMSEPATPAPADASPPVVFADGSRVLVKNPGGWQPSVADAMRADAGAGDYIRSQRPEIFQNLSRYIAQIYGVKDGDQSLIEMKFFCNAKLPTDDAPASPAPTRIEEDLAHLYLDGPARCHDGGKCCFSLFFDPASATYGGMRVNGR